MTKEITAMIKDADMNRDMQEDAVYIAANAIDEHDTEQEIARYIKTEFDQKHQPYWHCIVGGTFSSSLRSLLKECMGM
uniref:Dynein light chain n=2 Tax=Trichobilharzia regenti TaxID=157069 RepID=A0AA85JKJ8_TRIRE|nr:unnamed protein product [Trichobilharzia regenti]